MLGLQSLDVDSKNLLGLEAVVDLKSRLSLGISREHHQHAAIERGGAALLSETHSNCSHRTGSTGNGLRCGLVGKQRSTKRTDQCGRRHRPEKTSKAAHDTAITSLVHDHGHTQFAKRRDVLKRSHIVPPAKGDFQGAVETAAIRART